MIDTHYTIKAFPDYNLSTLPAIPTDWQDASWVNDVCPSWQSGNLMVFIDYEKMEDREMDIEERYRVSDYETSDLYLATNDWQAVLDYVKTFEMGI